MPLRPEGPRELLAQMVRPARGRGSAARRPGAPEGGERPGAFWIHGLTPVARRLGPDIVESPLYLTDAHCAFGSEQGAGLPELLARYLEALRSAGPLS